MKKLIVFAMTVLLTAGLYAQTPDSFTYQAVVRDAGGNPLPTQPVGVQITILQGTLPGTAVYVETHAPSTNGFGLINLTIGGGTAQSGTIGSIDWSSGPFYLNVGIDIAGGTSYTDMGTVQLLSVPFALYAKTAANGFSGNYNDLTNAPDFTGWDQNESNDFSGNYNDLTNKPVLAGDVSGQTDANTVTAIQGMDVSTNIPANGQVLKWNNATQIWEPSDDQLGAAGTTDGVVTGAGFSGTATKTLTLIRSNGLGDITAVFTDMVDDADADPTNEIQNLTLTGNDLTISGSNTVTLPQTTYTAGSGINITTGTITNTQPDQTVTLTGSGATTVSGAYPNFTVTSTDNNTTYTAGSGLSLTGNTFANTSPDQTVTITGTGATSVTGTYPNFSVSSTDNNTTYTAGSGLSLTGTTFANTSPDQVVTMTSGTGISVTGTYPDFTIANTQPAQTVTMTGTGATTVTGTYPNFTISSTDNNTTYTAGTGLTLTGTQFSHNSHSGDVSGTTALTVTGIQGRGITATSPVNGQVLKYNGTNWTPATDNINDADADPSNEIQTLSLTGNNLSLSSGGNVSLVGYIDTLWRSNGTKIYNTNSGNVGVGINNPVGKMVVQGDATLTDSDPLFEVKDRTGATVFIVYPDSVRIFVGDDGSKTNKGAFAVSGRNTAKAFTHDFLTVRPDSTRIYTGNSTKGFGVQNIGSSTNDSYMQLTPGNYFIGHEAGKKLYQNPGYSGLYNSFFGYQSGYNDTSGYKNYFIGYRAGYNNTSGYSNIFIGDSAGFSNTTGFKNVFIGNQSGKSNLAGNYNVFLGYNTGLNNLAGFNVFVGYNCGKTNTSGTNNVFLGNEAGLFNTIGTANCFIGYNSGYNNTTGINNVYIGEHSGFSGTNAWDQVFIGHETGYMANGSCNTYLGNYAGRNNSTGVDNVFIGQDAGKNSTGSRNLFLGFHAGRDATSSDKLYIANSATNPPLIYGDFLTGYIGLGTVAPFCGIDVEKASNSANFAKFGNALPVYITANSPNIGFNAYWGGTGWRFGKGSSNNYAAIISVEPSTGKIGFNTTNAGNADAACTATNRMTILQNGAVGVGTAAPNELLEVAGYFRATGYRCRSGVSGSYGSNLFNIYWTGSSAQLWIDGVNIGVISTTSDRRLKEDINPITNGAISRLMKLQPVSFKYKKLDDVFSGDPSIIEGFIAQDLQTIIPSAVNGEKDALSKDGRIQPQTINVLPIVSVLTKALQEQQLIIEEQSTQIKALQIEIENIQKSLDDSRH